MLALLSPRLWLAIGLAVALAVSHGMAYKSGRDAQSIYHSQLEVVGAYGIASVTGTDNRTCFALTTGDTVSEIRQIPERHREAAATYAEGQRWETAIDTNAQTGEKIVDPIWTPVHDQPLWDKYQAYRRVA